MTVVLHSDSATTTADERLYGRRHGHRLRARQEELLRTVLPRLVFPDHYAAAPGAGFETQIQEVWLEIGAGSGEHALAQCKARPDIGLIACEVFTNGICSLLSALAPFDAGSDVPLLANLRIWPADARVLLSRLPPQSLDKLFLLFPDPWPKKRHAKRRFVHPSRLPLLARVMKPNSEWRIATDDPVHQSWIETTLAHQAWFNTKDPLSVRPSHWPMTRYEAKALRECRTPMYWSLRRTDRPCD